MIKIEAWQSRGIKQDRIVDTFEFCCWGELQKWMDNPKVDFHKCPKCKNMVELHSKNKNE